MPRLNADIVVALIALAVGAATLLLVPSQVSGESLAAIRDVQSPAFFPILAGLVMLACGAVLLGEAIADQRKGTGIAVVFQRPAYVGGAMVIIAALAAATPYIGMSKASGVAILALGLLIEPQRWRLILPAAVVVPTVIYLLFERLLLILLPEGSLI